MLPLLARSCTSRAWWGHRQICRSALLVHHTASDCATFAAVPQYLWNRRAVTMAGAPKNTEIERKYLAKGDAWRKLKADSSEHLRQGFLSVEKERTVRVRVREGKGYLTIKGISKGASRKEYEYEIPADEATEMLDNLCPRPQIEKVRHVINDAANGVVWEIDEFMGDNDGLVVIEVELGSEDQEYPAGLPEWVGREITGDVRFYNSVLSKKPFSSWTESERNECLQ